ncbi:hypothetical protein RJ639_031505 [Escallonia herrerae]|uniref:Uncharacterized protein n=1 Tax=Escallonia herrerae TaxID=1293975 RepID=A0AA89BHP8_9ASTE|nr:hypothetical protein RJ639_031505 [Escallonia herrerae]
MQRVISISATQLLPSILPSGYMKTTLTHHLLSMSIHQTPPPKFLMNLTFIIIPLLMPLLVPPPRLTFNRGCTHGATYLTLFITLLNCFPPTILLMIYTLLNFTLTPPYFRSWRQWTDFRVPFVMMFRAVRAITEIETEELSVIQVEVLKRTGIAASMIIGLEHESFNLKKKVMELTEEADVLTNWLKIHERSIIDMVVAGEGAEENAFEAVDKE